MNRMYTDLACEAAPQQTAGVRWETKSMGHCEATHVEVYSPIGERATGKPMGHYITLQSENLCKNEPATNRQLAQALCDTLRPMIPEGEGSVLVLGLGNRDVTPDALGAKTVKRLFVSRHILRNIPDAVDERVRDVCALAPGVLGVTGMETGEVALGVVHTIAPKCVICIDSLCALSLTRLLTTLQIADTGICPGSGLNNPRRELTHRTLGVPVLAIGVPLVVSAASLCPDLADSDMVVTPKQIDEAVENAAAIIAAGLNMALHPQIAYEEFADLV